MTEGEDFSQRSRDRLMVLPLPASSKISTSVGDVSIMVLNRHNTILSFFRTENGSELQNGFVGLYYREAVFPSQYRRTLPLIHHVLRFKKPAADQSDDDWIASFPLTEDTIMLFQGSNPLLDYDFNISLVSISGVILKAYHINHRLDITVIDSTSTIHNLYPLWRKLSRDIRRTIHSHEVIFIDGLTDDLLTKGFLLRFSDTKVILFQWTISDRQDI